MHVCVGASLHKHVCLHVSVFGTCVEVSLYVYMCACANVHGHAYTSYTVYIDSMNHTCRHVIIDLQISVINFSADTPYDLVPWVFHSVPAPGFD